MTSFIIEHQCPQCGAPATLQETDRLFRCDFCRAGAYLSVPDVFRYTMPAKAPADKELVYFPYWRFKGMLFSCTAKGITQRFIDVSHQAIASLHFPISVGFRSQTQKLRFATADDKGIFLKPVTPFADVLPMVNEQFSAHLPKPILYQAHIGETLSLLYAPFYVKEKIYDAIVNEPLDTGNSEAVAPLLERSENPHWPITFIPTLCPQCGWDLTGDRDSLALNCTNCQTIWWAKKGKLSKLKAVHVPQKGPAWVYMPFWRIKADVSHIALNTYADLIKTANLPKVVQPGWDKVPFYFWSPAFKVRPQSLLTFAGNVTLNQPIDRLEPGQPNNGRLHAVNMPLQEALESLKLILARFMRPRERMVATIPEINIEARRFVLVYLPFKEGLHELVHERLKLAINKNLLVHARNL